MSQHPKHASKKVPLRKTPYALALVAALGLPAVSHAAYKEPSGPEFKVNQIGLAGTTQANAVVASDKNGDFVVVWQDGPNSHTSSPAPGPDGSGYGIFAQRYKANGQPQGNEIYVNAHVSGDQVQPAVAMDDNGDFVIAWTDKSGEDGAGDGVFAQEYYANGTASGEFQVNTTSADNQEQPAVAMDAGGDFVVSWTTFAYYSDIYARRFSAGTDPSTSTSTEFLVTTKSVAAHNGHSQSSVAMDDAGDFVIAWTSYGEGGYPSASGEDIRAERFDSKGDPQTSNAVINVNTYTSGNQNHPAVAMDANGEFVVAWEDDSGEDLSGAGVFANVYNSDGTALTSEFEVNQTTAGPQELPNVSMDTSGDFVVTWENYTAGGSYSDVYERRYSADGQPATDERELPTASDNTPTYTGGFQNSPDVALDSQGDYIVAWSGYGSNQYGVYAQRFGFPKATTGSTNAFGDGRGGGFGCTMAPANDPNGHAPLLGLMTLLSGLFIWRRRRTARNRRPSR